MEQARSVISEVRGAARWLRINRPAALNAIDPSVVDGLMQGLDQATAEAGVAAVVLTGTGRAFCAGADLKFVRRQAEGPDAFLQGLLTLLNRLEAFPKPVIAAVNGLALAGGLELVLCCDLVLAARSATFGDAHANYGLLPGGGGSVRLPRKIGSTRAKYLLYTGESASAEAMAEAGLVNAVVADDMLPDAAGQLIDRLARKSPLGLQRMKQLIDQGLEQPIAVALQQELQMSALHKYSHDMAEGLAAFDEKRRPRFLGR